MPNSLPLSRMKLFARDTHSRDQIDKARSKNRGKTALFTDGQALMRLVGGLVIHNSPYENNN